MKDIPTIFKLFNNKLIKLKLIIIIYIITIKPFYISKNI